MASEKVETVIAGNYLEMEREEGDSKSAEGKFSKLFWHGGSVYDAWFSCASNQACTCSRLLLFSLFFVGLRLMLCNTLLLIIELLMYVINCVMKYRLHKCFSHCLIHFHNWGWYLESFFSFFMGCWEAGLLT
jgi:hypothetical protein